MVATSIVFSPAPLFLFMHGKEITIPKGTEVIAFINGDVPLALAKFQPQVPVPVVAASPSSEQTTIEFTSIPMGAEIEVDGNYAGKTPSSETLALGEHSVKLTKAGYKSWERKIKTNAGHINVTAELEQEASPAPVATTATQPQNPK